MSDAQQIADYLEQTGDIYRPISEARVVECEHGMLGWYDCHECMLIQIIDAIRTGQWKPMSNRTPRRKPMSKPKTITIEDTEYIRADSISKTETPSEDYVIIRSDRAGVFAGHLVEHDRATQYVVLKDTRRLWYWIGASLSEVAQKGAIEPDKCKYSVPVAEQTIGTVIEVIPASDKAMKSIKGVKEWVR